MCSSSRSSFAPHDVIVQRRVLRLDRPVGDQVHAKAELAAVLDQRGKVLAKGRFATREAEGWDVRFAGDTVHYGADLFGGQGHPHGCHGGGRDRVAAIYRNKHERGVSYCRTCGQGSSLPCRARMVPLELPGSDHRRRPALALTERYVHTDVDRARKITQARQDR